MLKKLVSLNSQKSKNKKSLGFTLIELLVTISIVGMLSSVAAVSANSTRVNARDSRRIQELQSLQKAMELYYADNGTYPYLTSAETYVAMSAFRTDPPTWNELATKLNPYTKLLNMSPAYGPSGQFTDIQYYTGSPGVNLCLYGDVGISEVSNRGYTLLAHLENPNNYNARNDKGIMSQAYELYGGEFWMNEPSSCD